MLQDFEMAQSALADGRGILAGIDPRDLDADFSCEPKRRTILVISQIAASIEIIEWALRHMSRFEPQITTAGSLAAAHLALAAVDFDLVVFVMDADRPGDALDIAAASEATLLIAPRSAHAVREGAARQGTRCTALSDVTPGALQDLLGR